MAKRGGTRRRGGGSRGERPGGGGGRREAPRASVPAGSGEGRRPAGGAARERVLRAAGALSALRARLDARTLAFGALLFSLTLTPEMRGLYFPFQLMEMVVVLVAALSLWVAREGRGGRGPEERSRGGPWWRPWGWFEGLAAILTGFYLLSGVWAADTRAAVHVALIYVFSLAGLLFVARLDEPRRRLILPAAIASGTLIALLGFAAAAGNLPHAHGFTAGTRILSALQYPNTTAAYLMVSMALAFGLGAGGAASGRRGAVLGAATAAMFVIFIYTQSRGALLVLPLVLLALWATRPRGLRLPFAQMVLAAIVGAVPGLVFLASAWNAETLLRAHRPGVWLALAAAALVGGAGGWFVTYLDSRRSRAGLWGTAGIALVGSLGSIAYLASAAAPKALLRRLADINLTTSSVADRLAFYRDALAIVRDHAFIGTGGGGWNAVYWAYRSFHYSTTQVHNDFLQVWVETGTVGLALYLALWVLFAAAVWRLWRRAAHAEGVVAGIAALGLGAHSFIDFNLSLAAVNLLLWCLWGVVFADLRAVEGAGAGAAAAPAETRRRRFARRGAERGPGWVPAAFHFACGAVVLGTLLLIVGAASGDRGAAALRRGDYADAERQYARAVAADPFNATYRMDYGQAAFVNSSGSGAGLADALDAMATAVAMAPWNANLHGVHASYLFQVGSVQAGYAEMKKALSLDPAEAKRYEALGDAALQIAAAYVNQGQPDSAGAYLEEALALPGQLKAEHDRQPDWAGPQRTPDHSYELDVVVGEAHAMLGDWEAAEPLLERALKAPKSEMSDARRATVYLWLGEVQAKAGNTEASNKSLDQAKKLDAADFDADKKTVDDLLGSVKSVQ